MSDTPRTECYVINPHPSVVPAEFARELERDVIRLQSVVANLFVVLERIRDGVGSPEVKALGVERALEWASNEAASALDKIKL